MWNYLSDSDIDNFINEDVPYGDLTTHLLGIAGKPGRIVFTAREETTLCCTEEASRVFDKFGAKTSIMLPSGTAISAGTDFLEVIGPAHALHSGWKAALNLLEYASGVASRTARIVKAARSVNPGISIVTTRKSFPGTKKIVIKAILAGGALPHRLGLSETILVFKQHTVFFGGLDEFLKSIPDLKDKAKETMITVEADTPEEALRIANAGVDIVQIDKAQPRELSLLVKEIQSKDLRVKISAAGGINESNIVQYAATGVDIIVLSFIYFGKPSDIAVRITPA